MIAAEEGELAKALGPLRRGHLSLDAEARPWLTVRCSLSLALCLAAFDRREDVRRALEDSRKLYPLVQEESELPVIKWLEGKVASLLGESAEAQSLLDSARRSLLDQNRLVEAGLVSLDLAALYVQAKRPNEILTLVTDLKRQSQNHGVGPVVIELLQRFGRGPDRSSERLRCTLRSPPSQDGPIPGPWSTTHPMGLTEADT